MIAGLLLLAAVARADTACCIPAENGKPRCLERLTRGSEPDLTTAACATYVGTTVARGHGQQPFCALPATEWRKHGFWQDGPPSIPGERAHYDAGRLAVASPACEFYRNPRCRDGYEPVHLYVSLSDDASELMTGTALSMDPWNSNASLRGNLIAENYSEFGTKGSGPYDTLSKRIQSLALNCKVVSYLMVSSHGSPGQVYIARTGARGTERTLTRFLSEVVSPCALAPNARVQFDGCMTACREVAEPLRQGFEKVLTGANYAAPLEPNPLEGVSILLSPSRMHDIAGMEKRYKFFGPLDPHAELRPDNGMGLMYSLRAGHVATDVPAGVVDACPSEWRAEIARVRGPISEGR